MSTNLRKQSFKFLKLPPKSNSWADLGPRSTWEKFSQMLVRSGEIPSPRQTSIDKTNDCAMKSEQGVLVRGSDHPSRHSVHKTTGETWWAPAGRQIQTHLGAAMLHWNRVKFHSPHWNQVNFDQLHKTQVNFDAHTKTKWFTAPLTKTKSISTVHTKTKSIYPYTKNKSFSARTQKPSQFRSPTQSQVYFDPNNDAKPISIATLKVCQCRCPPARKPKTISI